MLTGMTQLTRPAIGVLVDPERMAAARKSAMLERIELARLSQALDLVKIATDEGLHPVPHINLDQIDTDLRSLRKLVTDAGITIGGPSRSASGTPMRKPGVRIGVSRDEIAKLETGGRKRPKISTMRKLIATLNYARAELGKPPLQIEDLQVPGEVLIPETRKPEKISTVLAREAAEAEAIAEAEERQAAIDAYQEASNDIYYATDGRTGG